jgi:hypothetical protein
MHEESVQRGRSCLGCIWYCRCPDTQPLPLSSACAMTYDGWMPTWQARLSSTNANSPPWASMNPVRMLSDLQW